MIGALLNFIPPQYRLMVVGIVVALLLATLTAMSGVIWWQNTKIDDLNKATGTLTQQASNLSQELLEQTTSFNEKYTNLQKDWADERVKNTATIKALESTLAELSKVRATVADYAKKYEGDRLARLSSTKGGLLTRMAKTGALKRNEEWEDAAE